MKKKIAVLLCALSLAFCLTGCVNGQQVNTEPSVTEATLSEEEKAEMALKSIKNTLLAEFTRMDTIEVYLMPSGDGEYSITVVIADGKVSTTLNNLYIDISKSRSSDYNESKFTENVQKYLDTIVNGTYKAVIYYTDGRPKIDDVQKIG